MNTKLTTQNKAVVQCANKTIADDYVRRYQSSTRNALENILCMGEAVYEIYQKVKSKKLDKTDLEYFCQSVHLDPKSSTFRKYKTIGENASRFRKVIEKVPPTFSVMYELATLDGDDFEFFTKNTTLSKNTTLEEFKQMVRKAHSKSSFAISMPSKKIIQVANQQVQKRMNHFEFRVKSDIAKSDLDQIIDSLNSYKKRGWISFEKPEILSFIDDKDDDEKYFVSLAEQDARELRM